MASATDTPLSAILPPLIFGTATFNNLYCKDPYALDTKGLVREALEHGVRAFDTSPYYGPAEELLGAALNEDFIHQNFPREEYFILTKCGRISGDEFDYSASWIRKSIARSLERLHTSYLDVVYCHDVEFVSPQEVLTAVRELRRIRDEEKTIKHVGISGYPVDVLCSLAELIRDETGEPVDIVQSYANYTLQNTTLASKGVQRLKAAGVDVVTNASVLGMGLLRREGIPVGAHGDWHPSPPPLREAVRNAASFCDRHEERLEVIAIRYSLESWLEVGSAVGSKGDPASGVPWTRESNSQVGGKRLGVSLMGVSNAAELAKTMSVWRSILDGLEDGQDIADKAGRWRRAHEWSLNRKRAVQIMADGVAEVLDEWLDYAWASPPEGFVNQGGKHVEENGKPEAPMSPMLTPAASPKPEPIDSLPEAKIIPLR